jgi:hypothetical protein
MLFLSLIPDANGVATLIERRAKLIADKGNTPSFLSDWSRP